ncbi:hypothetical protein SUGI_0655730 [Cryptomeria japonica]|nr:hypothetical protein SUGI_0655730 [Cryptomeria japonica]
MAGPPLIPTAEAVEPALTPINSITTSSPAIKNNDLGSVKQNASSNTKTFSEAVGNSSVIVASAKFSVVHHHEEAEQGEAIPPQKSANNTKMNNSEPSDKTTKVPPVSSSPSATLNMEQAPPLVSVPSPEVNMIDGFQIVEKKSDKKRRRKTENTEAHIVKTNKANTPPVTPIPAAPPTLAETNPTAVVNKIFKEIDDGSPLLFPSKEFYAKTLKAIKVEAKLEALLQEHKER